MADKSSRNAFLIHLGAYLIVNAALFALNASQPVEAGEARVWWAIWPLAGWGIGILAHGFAYWAEKNARDGHLMADPDARGVAVHLFVYLAVNAFLIIINIKSSPDSMWAIWPILGWGLGLAAHAWLAYRKILRKTVERYATEQQVLTQMQLEQQAAAIAASIETKPAKKAPAKRRTRAAAKSAKTASKKTARKAPATKKTQRAKPATRRKPAAKRKPTAKTSRAKSS